MTKNKKLKNHGFDTNPIPYVGQNPFYPDAIKKTCLATDVENILNDNEIISDHDEKMRIPTIDPFELSDDDKVFDFTKAKTSVLIKASDDEIEKMYSALEKYRNDVIPKCPEYKSFSISKVDKWKKVMYRGIIIGKELEKVISKAENFEVLFYQNEHVASFVYNLNDMKQHIFVSDKYSQYCDYISAANALSHGFISEDLTKILFRYKEYMMENVVAQMHPVVQPDKPILSKQSMLEEEELEQEGITTEAADIDKDIKPIVDKLNKKGYKVKYSCSGHNKTRIKEDDYRDGIYKGDIYSTARLMFKEIYDLPDAPEFWRLKQVDGCSYMNLENLPYNTKDGTPEEAFEKWKVAYMASLKDWVDKLDSKEDSKIEPQKDMEDMDKEEKEDKSKVVDESVYDILNDIFEDIM